MLSAKKKYINNLTFFIKGRDTLLKSASASSARCKPWTALMCSGRAAPINKNWEISERVDGRARRVPNRRTLSSLRVSRRRRSPAPTTMSVSCDVFGVQCQNHVRCKHKHQRRELFSRYGSVSHTYTHSTSGISAARSCVGARGRYYLAAWRAARRETPPRVRGSLPCRWGSIGARKRAAGCLIG